MPHCRAWSGRDTDIRRTSDFQPFHLISRWGQKWFPLVIITALQHRMASRITGSFKNVPHSFASVNKSHDNDNVRTFVIIFNAFHISNQCSFSPLFVYIMHLWARYFFLCCTINGNYEFYKPQLHRKKWLWRRSLAVSRGRNRSATRNVTRYAFIELNGQICTRRLSSLVCRKTITNTKDQIHWRHTTLVSVWFLINFIVCKGFSAPSWKLPHPRTGPCDWMQLARVARVSP